MEAAGACTLTGHTDAMSHRRTLRAPRVARALPVARRSGGAALELVGALLAVMAAAVAVLLVVAATARAQDLDAPHVLEALAQRTAELGDIEFVLAGELFDEAGQRIAVEIEVMAMPNATVASLYIVRPDALADNQVIIDGDVIRNYTYLTNQVAVFHAHDPNALGGLFPEAAGATVDLDLGRVFDQWAVEVESIDGVRYVLRFENPDPAAVMRTVRATINSEVWLPARLVFYRDGDAVLADLRFVDMVVDQGLTREEIVYLPADAEVIDRRR
jgi:outer membrane lipoprotein-sorting protein